MKTGIRSVAAARSFVNPGSPPEFRHRRHVASCRASWASSLSRPNGGRATITRQFPGGDASSTGSATRIRKVQSARKSIAARAGERITPDPSGPNTMDSVGSAWMAEFRFGNDFQHPSWPFRHEGLASLASFTSEFAAAAVALDVIRDANGWVASTRCEYPPLRKNSAKPSAPPEAAGANRNLISSGQGSVAGKGCNHFYVAEARKLETKIFRIGSPRKYQNFNAAAPVHTCPVLGNGVPLLRAAILPYLSTTMISTSIFVAPS